MTEVYSHGGINWGWYIELERVNKRQCRIIKHWRIHYSTPNHPEALGTFRIKEDEQPLPGGWHSRNAIGVMVWDHQNLPPSGETIPQVTLKVLNPGYVFGYDGKTEQPAMHGK